MVRAILASTVVFLSLAVAVRAERPRIVDAAKSGDREAVRALVQARANVNAADADGTTALHWAVRQDDLALADRMLRSGADVDAANRYGVTPLHLAAVNGSEKMIERLLEAGYAFRQPRLDGAIDDVIVRRRRATRGSAVA